MAGGMQRGRAAGPLARMVLYYNTHLALRVIADSGVQNGPRGQSSNPCRLSGSSCQRRRPDPRVAAMPQTVRRTYSHEWVYQLDRLARHAMCQGRFVAMVQGMTGCTDEERDEELQRLLKKARLVLVTYMCSFEPADRTRPPPPGKNRREDQ